MSERRSAYRVESTGRAMKVSLSAGSDVFHGTVQDTSAGGAAVSFPTDLAPALEMGSLHRLTFTGGPLSQPVTIQARLRSRREAIGFRRYSFSFEDPNRVNRTFSEPAQEAFNRRAHPRIGTGQTEVPVEVLVDGHADHPLQGKLGDVSRGGMAVLLPQTAERLLAAVDEVACTLVLPNERSARTLRCTIRNRTLGDRVRYGMAFVAESGGTMVDDVVPAYEKMWNCQCGTEGLLTESQVFCPFCGAQRAEDAPTRFPSWDSLRTSADHPFCGDAQTCGQCQRTWAAVARFCGGCGHRLRT